MYCYQCQETVGNKSCEKKVGICGKDENTTVLQDLLIYTIKGIAEVYKYAEKFYVSGIQPEFRAVPQPLVKKI